MIFFLRKPVEGIRNTSKELFGNMKAYKNFINDGRASEGADSTPC